MKQLPTAEVYFAYIEYNLEAAQKNLKQIAKTLSDLRSKTVKFNNDEKETLPSGNPAVHV